MTDYYNNCRSAMTSNTIGDVTKKFDYTINRIINGFRLHSEFSSLYSLYAEYLKKKTALNDVEKTYLDLYEKELKVLQLEREKYANEFMEGTEL